MEQTETLPPKLDSLRDIKSLEAWVWAQDTPSLMRFIDLQAERLKSLPPMNQKYQYFIVRMMDILLSSIGIFIISPLLIAAILATTIDSPGSPIFLQQRWGYRNSKVVVFKIRSMFRHLSDHSGEKQAKINDERVTRVGNFIRKTSIDELPQLFNVLFGELSLVGPRAHPIKMFANGMLYEEFSDNYFLRHTVRPGITGLAQCMGWRGPTTKPKAAAARLYLDLVFVEKNNVWLQILILIYTLSKMIRLRLN